MWLIIKPRWLILVSIVCVFSLLSYIAKPISEGRVSTFHGDLSFSDRLFVLINAFDKPGESEGGIWPRLAYTTAQFAAVDLYDIGQGGNDIELMAWVFLPRALFPNKPIITRSGEELNQKITGFSTSSTGIGLFISGYFNLGWIGLIFVSVTAGVIMSVFSAVSRAIVNAGSLILFPVDLVGMMMGFRVDGHFVADYLGTFAMILMPLLTFLFIQNAGLLKVRLFSKR